MTPPPIAALALLGFWALLVFWVTRTTVTTQARAGDELESTAEPWTEQDAQSSDRSYHTADD